MVRAEPLKVSATDNLTEHSAVPMVTGHDGGGPGYRREGRRRRAARLRDGGLAVGIDTAGRKDVKVEGIAVENTLQAVQPTREAAEGPASSNRSASRESLGFLRPRGRPLTAGHGHPLRGSFKANILSVQVR
jgi:hypothetical protein